MFKKILYRLKTRLLHSKLNNERITILSNNCIGGLLYHNYHLEFLSPTINLFLSLDDFIHFIIHLEDYINRGVFKEIECNEFPKALLKVEESRLPTLIINFNHYASFNEAIKKWKERAKRINWSNIRVVIDATDLTKIGLNTIKKIKLIKYKKIILTVKDFGLSDQFIFNQPKTITENWIMKRKTYLKYNFEDYNFTKFFND